MLPAILLVLALLALLYFYSISKPKGFPPGPPWLPIVGSLPHLKERAKMAGGQHLALLEMSKQWKTNLLGLKLGRDTVVIVSSYPLIKKVFTSEDFDDRPNNFFIKLRNMGKNIGITCVNGALWKEQRAFVVRHLKTVGLGRSPMDAKIREELQEVLNEIYLNGNEVQISKLLQPAVISVIWSFIAGKRIDKGDPRMERFFDIFRRRSKAFDMAGGALSHYPWLRFIMPEKIGYNLIKRLNNEVSEFFMENIKEHHETWNEGEESDLIYSFITEMKQTNGRSTNFTHDQLVMICLDLFIGGAHSTSGTLEYALLLMLLNPDVQSKAQIALDRAFDANHKIDYADRIKIPYIEAVLSETQRYCTVAPLMGPRKVFRDVHLDGYTIPKDSTVLANVYSIYVNKDIWGDPETFRPERFLDEKGQFIAHEAIMPFAMGRRRCLAEPFARSFVFVFFAELLRHFTISPIPGQDLPSTKPLPGMLLLPQKYSANFVRRHRSDNLNSVGL